MTERNILIFALRDQLRQLGKSVRRYKHLVEMIDGMETDADAISDSISACAESIEIISKEVESITQKLIAHYEDNHPDAITTRKYMQRDPETLRRLGIFDK